MSNEDEAERDDTDGQQQTINRRRFVKSLGVAGGAAALGSLGTSRASARQRDFDKEEIHGRKRGQVLRSANTSEKVDFAEEVLGTRGGVESVFAYTLDDGTSGYGVIFGAGDEAEGPTIRYFKSDSFKTGEAVSGGKPSGGGSVGVVADGRVTLEIAGTDRTESAAKSIQNNDEYKAFKQNLDQETFLDESAISLAHTEDGTEEPTDILVPVMKDGKTVDKLVLSGPSWPDASNIENYSINTPNNESPVLQQDAPCGAICAVLSGGGYAACTGACLYDPITAPFALDCGTFCSAVIGGSCLPYCRNHT